MNVLTCLSTPVPYLLPPGSLLINDLLPIFNFQQLLSCSLFPLSIERCLNVPPMRTQTQVQRENEAQYASLTSHRPMGPTCSSVPIGDRHTFGSSGLFLLMSQACQQPVSALPLHPNATQSPGPSYQRVWSASPNLCRHLAVRNSLLLL